MPSRRLPNSIPAVLRTLKTARDKYKNTPSAPDRAISAAQFAMLTDTGSPESFLTKFERECSEVDIALAMQGALTTDLSQKAAKATMLVSHFHQVFDLAVARGEQAASARRFYGRDITATTVPPLGTYAEVVEEAQKIVHGEAARATAEGGSSVAMANPDRGGGGDGAGGVPGGAGGGPGRAGKDGSRTRGRRGAVSAGPGAGGGYLRHGGVFLPE